jgi:CRP/FNR family cyclic AMP-dependent transcriptional regulator
MQTVEPRIAEHPFCAGLDLGAIATLAACATTQRFDAGQYVLAEGGEAHSFYLLLAGRVALETHAGARGHITIETIEAGEALGWSWLFPPYRWSFSARALEPVEAIVVGADCLRRACEADPRLGYELMRRFARVIVERLQATRLQLLDVYAV